MHEGAGFILVAMLVISAIVWFTGFFREGDRRNGIGTGQGENITNDRATEIGCERENDAGKDKSSPVKKGVEDLNNEELENSAVVLLNGVTFEVRGADVKSYSCLLELKKKPLPIYMDGFIGDSLAHLRDMLEEHRRTRVRFASLPLPDSDQRSVCLVVGGIILERVRPRLNERVLAHFLSLGRSCLVERLGVVSESSNSLRAFVDLNTERSVREVYHQSVTRSRIWDLDLATLLNNNGSHDMWTGIDGAGNYIVKSHLFSDRDEKKANFRVIVELNEEAATVREISRQQWASTTYKSYKQLDHGEAVRGYCLQLYEKHRSAVYDQLKYWFVRRNPDLCQETGFPIFIDREFKDIYEDAVSGYMRRKFDRSPRLLENIESDLVRSYGFHVDSRINEGQLPTQFSDFCGVVRHLLSRTQEDEEVGEWESANLTEALIEELGGYDVSDFSRDLSFDRPLNRF